MLHDNYIISIAAGPTGDIWVATETGIDHYTHGTIVSHLQTTDLTVHLVFCDRQGTVWVGTDTGLYPSKTTGAI